MPLIIANELSEISRATEAVEEFCARNGLAAREANALSVVLDEVLSNVIRHGFPEGGPHQIEVAMNYSNGEVRIEVEDDGAAFDPTQVSPPVFSRNLAERAVGGLGLVFVRALTDSVEYRRAAERNHLILRRRVAGDAKAVEPSPALQMSSFTHGAGSVIAVAGRLDSEAARTLRDRLLNSIQDGPDRFAVDLSRVSYIGSAGIWALLAAEYLATARGGGLVVFGLSSEIRQLLERTGIAGALCICETAEAALATLQPAASR